MLSKLDKYWLKMVFRIQEKTPLSQVLMENILIVMCLVGQFFIKDSSIWLLTKFMQDLSEKLPY